MHKIIRIAALLAGALAVTHHLGAQQAKPDRMHIESSDVAVLFSLEHAQLAQVDGSRFWLKGGSVEASLTFWKGLGLSANLTGEHTANIQNSVGLSKIAYMVGPHLTFDASRFSYSGLRKYPAHLFGEALFGGVHAFDTVFPGTSGTTSLANAFSMQLGAGIDLPLKKGFGLRVPEIDYVHTTLPNNASNSQNDLRIAFGVSFRH